MCEATTPHEERCREPALPYVNSPVLRLVRLGNMRGASTVEYFFFLFALRSLLDPNAPQIMILSCTSRLQSLAALF